MTRECHVRFCESAEVRSLRATHLVVGFQHEADARRFWDEMRERLRRFSLSLHPAEDCEAREQPFVALNGVEIGLRSSPGAWCPGNAEHEPLQQAVVIGIFGDALDRPWLDAAEEASGPVWDRERSAPDPVDGVSTALEEPEISARSPPPRPPARYRSRLASHSLISSSRQSTLQAGARCFASSSSRSTSDIASMVALSTR